jgi:hypothetical protein
MRHRVGKLRRAIREKKMSIPTTTNSMGMKILKKLYKILRTGHPSFVFTILHERGERTRVSHAATVRVQTKKYLWAERWGGRSRDGGSWVAIMRV